MALRWSIRFIHMYMCSENQPAAGEGAANETHTGLQLQLYRH